MGQRRPLFIYFQIRLYRKKIEEFSGIQTRIVGVKGEQVDQLTMAQ